MVELKKKDLKELQKQMPKLPKIHTYQCNDCLHIWESKEEYSIQSYCPKCKCGDISEQDNLLEDN